MNTCTCCEIIVNVCLVLNLGARCATSFCIIVILFFDYKSKTLLLAIFALLCFLSLLISFIFACCFACKIQCNSSDDYRYELISENERRKNYKFLIFFEVISYLFTIGIIEEYSRINTIHMSTIMGEIFVYHIIAFLVDIVVNVYYYAIIIHKNNY